MYKIITLAALTLAGAASAQTTAPTPRTERWSIEVRDVPSAEARRGITPRSGRFVGMVQLREGVATQVGEDVPYIDLPATIAMGGIGPDGVRRASVATLHTGTRLSIARTDAGYALAAKETRLVRWTRTTVGDEAFVVPQTIEAGVTLPIVGDDGDRVVGGYERPSVSTRPGIQRIFILKRLDA